MSNPGEFYARTNDGETQKADALPAPVIGWYPETGEALAAKLDHTARVVFERRTAVEKEGTVPIFIDETHQIFQGSTDTSRIQTGKSSARDLIEHVVAAARTDDVVWTACVDKLAKMRPLIQRGTPEDFGDDSGGGQR